MSEQVELLAMRDDAGASDSDEVCSNRSEGTVNSSEVATTAEQKYRTYHRRWYLLSSICLLSLSNGMVCYFFVLTFSHPCCLDVADLRSYSRSYCRIL